MNYPSCWLASFRSNDHAPPKLVCLNFSQPPHFLAELAGNITSIATLANGESDAQSFSYDSLNRLLAATATGASPYTESYSYDVIGNITAFNGAAYSYSGSQPHAVVTISGGQSFSYDDNGNMTARNDGTGSYTQAWDVENRLVQVTDNGSGGVTTFTYDAGGNRVKTVKPDGRITYTPFPHYEETVDGAATTTRATYMLGGQPIAVRVTGDPDPANNGLFTLYSDHLGSVSAMSDENGVLVPGSLARYTPFGGYRAGSGGNEVTDRGFTGHKQNDDLGLIYMNARYYVVGIGRFASADTIVPDPTNPQSLNRYTYVLNSPIGFKDPSGHNRCGSAGTVCNDSPPSVTIGSVVRYLRNNLTVANLKSWWPLSGKVSTHPDGTRVSSPTSSDVTAWLTEQMVEAATGPVVAEISRFRTSISPGEREGALLAWASLVKTDALWDFKFDLRKAEGVLFNEGDQKNLITLGGNNLNYQAVANIFYGFVGRSAGYSAGFLQFGAGMAQLKQWGFDNVAWGDLRYWGDQAFDAWAVGFGFYLYDLYGSDPSQLTQELITSALNDYIADNEPPYLPTP